MSWTDTVVVCVLCKPASGHRPGARLRDAAAEPVRFEISAFDFEMQDSSNFNFSAAWGFEFTQRCIKTVIVE